MEFGIFALNKTLLKRNSKNTVFYAFLYEVSQRHLGIPNLLVQRGQIKILDVSIWAFLHKNRSGGVPSIEFQAQIILCNCFGGHPRTLKMLCVKGVHLSSKVHIYLIKPYNYIRLVKLVFAVFVQYHYPKVSFDIFYLFANVFFFFYHFTQKNRSNCQFFHKLSFILTF